MSVSPKSASKGTAVTITATPNEGYEISSVTVTGEDGKEISVTGKGNGKYEPMCWTTMNGIIQGMGNGLLNPTGKATRAQAAAMIMRFCEKSQNLRLSRRLE